MDFLLFCGAGNSLSSFEVSARIPNSSISSSNIFRFSMSSVEEAIQTVSILGSSIKLVKLMDGVACDSDSVSKQVNTKNFSTNILNGPNDSKLNNEIKSMLPKSRFLTSQEYYGLSPILITKKKVDEFFLDMNKNEVWKTIWVHDFKHWIKKDRFLPFANARAGMLPPKIARSMINLAPSTVWGKGKTLVDPFCGSGRIPIEALELGFDVFGCDISLDQVNQSSKNLTALGYDGGVITCQDSTHISQVFKQNIDLIVTEPFMGKTKLRPDRVKYVVPGLKKLYLGSLKDWVKCLKPGGVVIMVFPVFNDGKRDYKTSDIIDDRLKLSYNHLNKGIFYSKPDAMVKREIHILQKPV